MGILDWIKGSKRAKAKRHDTEPKQVLASKIERKRADEIERVRKELERQREANRLQERKLKEMEARFSEAQSRFVELMEKQSKSIEMLLEVRTDEPTSVTLDQFEEAKMPPHNGNVGPEDGPSEEDVDRGDILKDKTFDNFVVDDSNRFAYLAAEAAATGIGRKYNPLFVYGPPGVGKTHLLHALANKMLENKPDLKVMYSSTEVYTDEIIAAIERDDLKSFRKRYHDLDVLLIDDVQTLSGKETTQMEFFHLFNHLYNAGKQIVLCSDRPPMDIKELESRLKSRFEGGLIIDINIPTFEGRRQILYNLSMRNGLSLSTEVMDYMAYYLDSNIRELEGGFNRVTAYASLMKEPITISLVRKVLEGVLLGKPGSMTEKKHVMEIPSSELEDVPPGLIVKNKVRPVDHELEKETDLLEKELLKELKLSK
ncbi:MAG: DnaA/Hda family protein [Candidatus Thermoplasmatota archaeon]|nr:DnaA/Hda family protein [Candidatus Thermoplasmatota archaeon]